MFLWLISGVELLYLEKQSSIVFLWVLYASLPNKEIVVQEQMSPLFVLICILKYLTVERYKYEL